jgi:hypothetical protein
VVGQVLGRAVVDLAKEALDAAALRVRVVDPYVVVLARGGLLHERLRVGGWWLGLGSGFRVREWFYEASNFGVQNAVFGADFGGRVGRERAL